ncbi:hypothetical protein [Lacrimispora sp.]|uniref:hypothetical protein n=1 Tax=Lacrimispora sp. TaxID=2719234 RepID=UPI003460286C
MTRALYPIYKYGENDFSLSVVDTREQYEIEEELFLGSLRALSSYLDQAPISNQSSVIALFQAGPDQYKICIMKDTAGFYDLYRDSGYSERGSMYQILMFAKEIAPMNQYGSENESDMKLNM